MRWSRTWQRSKRNFQLCAPRLSGTRTVRDRQHSPNDPPAGHHHPPNVLLATPSLHHIPRYSSTPISDVRNIKKHFPILFHLCFITHFRHRDPVQTLCETPPLRLSPSLFWVSAGRHFSLIALCAPSISSPNGPHPNGYQNSTPPSHLLSRPFRFRPKTIPFPPLAG